ncbi:MAG: biotin/lipoyl-containing protein [Bdellovibrionales bacterium]
MNLKKAELEIDGKKILIPYTQVGDKLWYHLNGETYTVSLKSKSAQRKKGKEGEDNQVRSPMPGKVTKILVQGGASVEQKQTLIVLEAMKMEYNLKAGLNGKVKAIHCKVGDQVEQDKLLLEIDPV